MTAASPSPAPLGVLSLVVAGALLHAALAVPAALPPLPGNAPMASPLSAPAPVPTAPAAADAPPATGISREGDEALVVRVFGDEACPLFARIAGQVAQARDAGTPQSQLQAAWRQATVGDDERARAIANLLQNAMHAAYEEFTDLSPDEIFRSVEDACRELDDEARAGDATRA